MLARARQRVGPRAVPRWSRSSCDDPVRGRSRLASPFGAARSCGVTGSPPLDGSTFSVAMLVVSRPRASCDAGLLIAAMCFAGFSTPFRMLRCQRMILFAPCDAPKIARRLVPHPSRMATFRARLPTFTACSPSRCLSPASIFRRPRAQPLRGPTVVRLPLARKTSLDLLPLRSRPRALGRVHLRVSTVLASRRSRATPFGSQSTGSRARVTFRREKASIFFLFEDRTFASHPATTTTLTFRRWRPPCRTAPRLIARLSTFKLHVFHLSRPPFRAFATRGRRTMTCFSLAHLSTYKRARRPSSCLRSPVFLGQTSARNRSFFDRSTPRDVSRPLLLRRSDRPASLDAHDPSALPCSRSRNVLVSIRVFTRFTITHLFSPHPFERRNLSISAPCDGSNLSIRAPDADPCRFQHSECLTPFGAIHSAMSSTSRCPKPFGPGPSRDAA